MSATTGTDDLKGHAAAIAANADLSATEITESVAGALVELYSGRVSDATVTEDDETITITFSKNPGAFEPVEGDTEDVANAAPSYEQWLRDNSSRELPPERDEAALGETYGDWLARRGREE